MVTAGLIGGGQPALVAPVHRGGWPPPTLHICPGLTMRMLPIGTATWNISFPSDLLSALSKPYKLSGDSNLKWMGS